MKKLVTFLTNNPLWIICFAGLLVRLILLPFVQVSDADATTRIFNSIVWMEEPHLISSGIWLPIHYYFTAFAMWIFPDRVMAPILLHILFAVFTAVPLYKMTERMFNKRSAILAASVYVLAPVVMRDSYHALAGVPFAFFVAWSFYYLYKMIFDNSHRMRSAILSGLFITIAAGVRYEAWMLIAVFCFIILVCCRWKELFIFFPIAMIFPLFWMIGNYIEYQDILYGVHGADYWNIQMEGVNDNLITSEIKRRFLYFPLSWVIQQSIIPALLIIVGLVYVIATKKIYDKRYLFLLPFLAIIAAFSYKAVMGTLLTQHRFTILPILLSLPFIGTFFEIPLKEIWQKTISYITIILTLPIGFLLTATYPIPRISNQSAASLLKQIVKEKENKSLILDCFGWDNSFYAALYSRIPQQDIFITDCSAHGVIYKEENLFVKLNAHQEGFLVLANQKLQNEIEFVNSNTIRIIDYPKLLYVEKAAEEGGLTLYKYKIE